MNPAVARDIAHIAVMAKVACRIAPGPNRGACTTEASLRAERGVFVEQLGVVVGVEQQHEVGMPYVAAGSIYGLEGEAGAVAKAGADCPAGLLLEGSGARRRDDLGVDGGSGVCDVHCRAARRSSSQRDGGSDGERRAAGQRPRSVFGGYDIGLHRGLGGV